MRLYSGSSKEFIEDTTHNQITQRLKQAFFNYFRYYPSASEEHSWLNSLRAMSLVLIHAKLNKQGVILEYQLPLTSKRLDCLLTGVDEKSEDSAVIIELKQWDHTEPAVGENEVATVTGRRLRDVLHPSVQVGQYRQYLADAHTAFYDENAPINLSACSYLHNYIYKDADALLADKFDEIRTTNPIFSSNDTEQFVHYLEERIGHGNGMKLLKKIEGSEYRPSRKLLGHVSDMIHARSEYTLLDEQLVVYDTVQAEIKAAQKGKQKVAIVVKGGPGTGKSVIAINLMADLLREGFNAQYATGSRAFTETLRNIIGPRGAVQFKYFNSYMAAEENIIDVLVSDEAHRIRKSSNNRFTKADKRSNLPQIDELLHVARLPVFLIDDDQIVRPDEIGSSAYIKEHAESRGYRVIEFELDAQFRCNGSDGFINWIDNTLGVKRTANVIWDRHDEFDFRLIDTPEELDELIRKRSDDGFSARLMAGFCWPWSHPDTDGTLVNDIKIGRFERPWNARPEATRLAAGIPKASLWAYDPGGVDQVGCIYTAQGFEFDYAGVIFGKDLVYNPQASQWEAEKDNSYDSALKRSKDQALELLKNSYRVLLTRGMKGCYVYFEDEATRNYFKSRIER